MQQALVGDRSVVDSQELQRLDLRQMSKSSISHCRVGALELVKPTQLFEMNEAVVGDLRPGQFDLFQLSQPLNMQQAPITDDCRVDVQVLELPKLGQVHEPFVGDGGVVQFQVHQAAHSQ